MMKDYSISLINEIESNKDKYKDLKTIYIGGGTPTYYPYLEDILIKLSEVINLNEIKEFTIESTIETVLDYIDIYNKYNINRLSIGVESFNKKTIKYINRKYYSYKDIKIIINKLKDKGIRNINLDLIYSLPFETLSSIKRTIKYLKKLDINHVSYYDLILESYTKLSYDLNNNLVKLPNENINIKMRNYINNKLNKIGFNRYEISNYSKPGYESMHNISYWNMTDYLGLGLNSHSKINNKRFSNTSNIKEYISEYKDINHNPNYIYYEMDEMSEYFILGLRMIEGVSIDYFINKYNIDPFKKYPKINKMIDYKLLEMVDGYLRLTNKGINLGNQVFEVFI